MPSSSSRSAYVRPPLPFAFGSRRRAAAPRRGSTAPSPGVARGVSSLRDVVLVAAGVPRDRGAVPPAGSRSNARMAVATRSRNARSCVTTITEPSYPSSISSSAASVGRSRSFVGSSNTSRFAPSRSTLASATRARSPPESDPTFCRCFGRRRGRARGSSAGPSPRGRGCRGSRRCRRPRRGRRRRSTCRRRARPAPGRGTRRGVFLPTTIAPAATCGPPRAALPCAPRRPRRGSRAGASSCRPRSGPTMPMRSPAGTMRSKGALSAARARRRRDLQRRGARGSSCPARGDAAVTSDTSPGRPAVAGPRASSACARSMRAFCFVLRALGPRESHSRSRRRMFCRFCSTRSSWAMSSAFFSR